MAILSTKIKIEIEPTLIVPADPDGVNISLRVAGSHSVYIGGADVTSDTGFEMKGDNGILTMSLSPDEPLYGVLEEEANAFVLVLATAYG